MAEEHRKKPDTKPLIAMEDVKTKALRQVEYYLSDESFPFDEYLQSLCDSEKWIPIASLAAFPKMQTITKDVEVVTSALADSDSLEVSGDKVRRKFPLPDEDENKDRTVHCAGFAVGGDVAETLSKFGEVENVRPLRNLTQDSRALDGSCFVVFKDAKMAAKAAAANGSVFGGRKVTMYGMTDWFERLKKKRDAMRKKKEPKKYDQKAVLKFEGLDKATVSREDLRALCESHSEIKFIEYERGAPVGYVRFAENQAPSVLEKLGATVTINDIESTVTLLEGEDEPAYWARADLKQRKRKSHQGGARRKKPRR